MKSSILYLSLCLLLLQINSHAQYCIPEEGEKFYNTALKEINDKHVRWIKSEAAMVKANNLSPQTVQQHGIAYGQGLQLSNMDIEGLISLVMMMVAKDAETDLRDIMEKIKQSNENKKTLRDILKKVREQQKNQLGLLLSEYDSLKKLAGFKPDTVKKIRPGIVPIAKQKITAAELEQFKEELMEKLDSLNELSEMMSLRLQMYMDRYTKFLSTVSNLLKKISDTASTITQNLK